MFALGRKRGQTRNLYTPVASMSCLPKNFELDETGQHSRERTRAPTAHHVAFFRASPRGAPCMTGRKYGSRVFDHMALP